MGQRQVQTFNSAWKFSSEVHSERIVDLPHTWNAEDAFRDGKEYFRGKGTYSRNLYTPQKWQNKQVFLKFEGSNQITRLYVNEQLIGEHPGGYTGFVFDITKALKPGAENELKIEVDNSHNADIPPLDADFNFYGGIYRDLWLITTPKLHFETANEAAGNFLITTPEVSAEKATYKIETRLVNSLSQRISATIEAEIFDPQGNPFKILRKKIRIAPGATEAISFEEELRDPQLWSPARPQLYKAEVRVIADGEILDILISSFGFRWFEADPEKGFFLNGIPLKLIGANRHQDHFGLGNALPNRLHQRDYEMIKEMGANFIRTAHYPQDPEVYRICDELGLLVWSEVPVINDVTASQAYHDVSLRMQREQILQFFNHPSIIMWGHMNEIFIRLVFNNKMTEPEKAAKIKTSVELAGKLEKVTKELDPDRLTVMALHENELYNTSGIADIPDVIGWNLYFGWYSPGLESFGKFLDQQHERYPNRPLFISEYGPGADVRIQTTDPQPWDYSEAYQLKLHRSYLNQVLERDYVFGMAAWNFADFGSSFRQDAMPYINQKGLVNFDRSKKDIYYYYQARLLEEPMIYVAGENFQERYVENAEDKVEITIFSNASEVTLTTSEESYSAKTEDGIAIFKIPLPEGKNQVMATAGEVSHSRTFEVHYRENLVGRIGKKALTINVGAHVQYKDPVTGEIWIADQEYKEGSFGYVGGEVFQKDRNKIQGTASDIQGTENDPLFQTMREGIEAYKFDVEKGNYLVTLMFAEPQFNASEALIYNLSSSEEKPEKTVRSFDIMINGRLVQQDLNLARDYGKIRAVTITYEVQSEGEINVEFVENSGATLISAIKLEKL
ncbi:glycoside hydrolase family 2 [Salinimicrobium sp. CDJ15-91]|uniref:Glycoside hydrolase family 2 n=2 Tax=Salinimicrobium oceani TaxID=2722702 RepID=A0ABX1D5Q2_9FLAO|nr:glycoside hydrolase family 2 [Salinimicrobium oceani]